MDPLRHPLLQFRQPPLQQLIALGMGHNRPQAHLHHARERLFGGLRNQEIGELHQQIPAVIDGIPSGYAQRVLDILQRHVEIAAVVNLRSIAHRRLQFADLLLHHQRVEEVLLIRVRAGHDVRGARRGRLLQHGDRLFQTLGPIIQTGQNVTVYIDHE